MTKHCYAFTQWRAVSATPLHACIPLLCGRGLMPILGQLRPSLGDNTIGIIRNSTSVWWIPKMHSNDCQTAPIHISCINIINHGVTQESPSGLLRILVLFISALLSTLKQIAPDPPNHLELSTGWWPIVISAG